MPGKLIVGMGLPGSGKSSLFKRLAELTGGRAFLEPEEDQWTNAVHEREKVGFITALTWFRATRVPLLYEADTIRSRGGTAFVDTYYDKLIGRYLGKPGLEWLISADDPYYPVYEEFTRLDSLLLPNADVVVGIRVPKALWVQRLASRGRRLDADAALVSTYPTQDLFLDAARDYCADSSKVFLEFVNDMPTLSEAVTSLHQLLKEHL